MSDPLDTGTMPAKRLRRRLLQVRRTEAQRRAAAGGCSSTYCVGTQAPDCARSPVLYGKPHFPPGPSSSLSALANDSRSRRSRAVSLGRATIAKLATSHTSARGMVR
jgi:hypothetical protein